MNLCPTSFPRTNVTSVEERWRFDIIMTMRRHSSRECTLVRVPPSPPVRRLHFDRLGRPVQVRSGRETNPYTPIAPTVAKAKSSQNLKTDQPIGQSPVEGLETLSTGWGAFKLPVNPSQYITVNVHLGGICPLDDSPWHF